MARRIEVGDIRDQSGQGRVAGLRESPFKVRNTSQPQGICARLRVAPTATPADEIAIPCHPADAVGLALRVGAPIHATGAALDRATRRGPSGEPSEVSAWIERVRPTDFVTAPEQRERTAE